MRCLSINCLLGFVLFSSSIISGCQTTESGSSENEVSNPRPPKTNVASLRDGDTVIINLQSIPDPAEFDMQIDETGNIRLRYLGSIEAAGLTSSELANRIQDAYLENGIYKQIDVSVTLTDRYVYVGGEVKQPGPVRWTNDLTLVKAITAAGGFSLYAKKSSVQLNREDNNYTIDAKLANDQPSEDVDLLPGDSLFVPRSPF